MVITKKRLKQIIVALIKTILIWLLFVHAVILFLLMTYPLQLTKNKNTGAGAGFAYLSGVQFDTSGFFDTYEIEHVEIASSFDGHSIPADYITVDQNKNRPTVIMVHGSGSNRMTTYPMAELFLEMGYNVITYDQRSSGENTAKYTTFGYWERYDVQDYVSYARQFVDADEVLGLWGTSYGGATIGLALGLPEVDRQVDFAVFDCPLGNMGETLKVKMQAYKIGWSSGYMLPLGSALTKAKLGFSYADVDVYAAVSRSSTPILVYHSLSDQVTPWYMAQQIYDASPSDTKYIYTAEDSWHVNIFYDHYEDYRALLAQFLDAAENEKWAGAQ